MPQKKFLPPFNVYDFMTMEKTVIRIGFVAKMMTASTLAAAALASLSPTTAHATETQDTIDQATPSKGTVTNPVLLAQYASPNYGPPPPGYGSPPPPPPPGYYPPPRHYGYGRPVYQAPAYMHDGFYLHLDLGYGYTSFSANYTGQKMTISGGSVAYGIAAGGVIAPNLILFGTFYGNTISDPDVSYGGVPSNDGNGTDASVYSLGAGLAYYLMPVNVYFSFALSATWLKVEDSYYADTYLETNTGLGFQGKVGKEWWVWPGWGMGVAGQLTVASMKSSDFDNVRWTGTSFSVLFSATFN